MRFDFLDETPRTFLRFFRPAGKKVFDKTIDVVANIVEAKLKTGDGKTRRKVVIYGPNGKPHTEVIAEPEKPKRTQR